MKKLVGLLFFLPILVFASPAIDLDCRTVYINEESSCDININNDANVKEVSFNLENNVKLVSNLIIENNDNKYTITNIGNTKKIGTLKFSTSNKEMVINITNIILKGDANYSQDNLRKEVNVIEKTSNYLTDIKIDNVSINGFNKDTLEYEVVVDKKIVEVTVTQEDDNSMVTGTGFKTLAVGNNKIVITNVDANGEEKEYLLNIKYVVPKNTDNTLKKLELYSNNKKLGLSFERTISNYDLTVGASVSIIKINAILNNEKASFIEGYGPRDVELEFGENTIEIKTKSENGEEKLYQILVIRLDNRKWDDRLSRLSINGQDVKLKDGVYNYTATVRYNVSKSEIVAVASDSKVKIDYEDIDLVTGKNEIPVTLILNDHEVRVYHITINKLTEEESKYVLESIAIVNNDFNFDVNKTDYNIKLSDALTSLDFVILPNEGIKYEVLNNSNLRDKSTVIVNVRDDLGSKSYTFNIEKEDNQVTLKAISYGTFIVGLFAFITSILRLKLKSH